MGPPDGHDTTAWGYVAVRLRTVADRVNGGTGRAELLDGRLCSVSVDSPETATCGGFSRRYRHYTNTGMRSRDGMIPDRWNGENLFRALRQPRLIEREFRIWLTRFVEPVYNYRYRQQYSSGSDVMSEEWDNLLILDACRYDAFTERNTLAGELEPVVSSGSTSAEFIERNFHGRTLHDTVYVTANPYVETLSEDVFYTVENLLIDAWEPDPGTVPPDAVVDAAVAAHEAYPNKRLVVHFMQPHTPYLGPTAREIRSRVGLNDGFNKYQCVDGVDTKLSGESWFGSVMQGRVSRQELWRAYEETLDIVLESASDLLSRIDGSSVVTADHGEFLGERLSPLGHRRYGHPPETYTPELRVVPWLHVPGADRREVVPEDPIGFDRLDQATADDRLRALGYVPD